MLSSDDTVSDTDRETVKVETKDLATRNRKDQSPSRVDQGSKGGISVVNCSWPQETDPKWDHASCMAAMRWNTHYTTLPGTAIRVPQPAALIAARYRSLQQPVQLTRARYSSLQQPVQLTRARYARYSSLQQPVAHYSNLCMPTDYGKFESPSQPPASTDHCHLAYQLGISVLSGNPLLLLVDLVLWAVGAYDKQPVLPL